MHRHRLLIALASVTLVASACGDDDDAANETVPGLPTGPLTTPVPTAATAPPTTIGAATVPETPVAITFLETTVPETTTTTMTVPETTTTTTVPETTTTTTTTVPETTTTTTTTVPETTTTTTTTVPETTTTTTVPETTVVETTEPVATVVETTVVETTEPVATTVVETTDPVETTVVETTVVETTEPVATTVVENTVSPDTTLPSTTVPITDVVLLTQNGLGLVTFGDDPEDAIVAVTAVLGAPTEDTGWSDPLAISACSGTQVRRVSWGSLSLFFGDDSPIAQGTQHLFSYSYGDAEDLEAAPVGLSTPEGIGLGTTVQFLRAAYPDVVIDAGEEGIIEPSFFVNDMLSGRLTGGGDDDLVTAIIGGDACGV